MHCRQWQALGEHSTAIALADQRWSDRDDDFALKPEGALAIIDSTLLSSADDEVKKEAASVLLAHSPALFINPPDDALIPNVISSGVWLKEVPQQAGLLLVLAMTKLAAITFPNCEQSPSRVVSAISAHLLAYAAAGSSEPGRALAAHSVVHMSRVLAAGELTIFGDTRLPPPEELREQPRDHIGQDFEVPSHGAEWVKKLEAWADASAETEWRAPDVP